MTHSDFETEKHSVMVMEILMLMAIETDWLKEKHSEMHSEKLMG